MHVCLSVCLRMDTCDVYLRGEYMYRAVQKKTGQSLMLRHFATVGITWFSPKCSEINW